MSLTMLSNETMNALADMFAAEPALAKQVAQTSDPDAERALVRTMAAERGIVWREEPLHVLSDAALDGVSGGMTSVELAELEHQEAARRIEICRAVLTAFPSLCNAGEDANRLGWYYQLR